MGDVFLNIFKELIGRGPQGRTENRKNFENFKNLLKQ